MYDCMPQQGKQNHCILYRRQVATTLLQAQTRSNAILRMSTTAWSFAMMHMVSLRACFHETMKFPKLWECVSGIVAHADARVHGRKNAQ